MNKYVKIKGYSNWFLLLEANQSEPSNLSEIMQEKILRSEVCKLHDPKAPVDITQRIKLAATHGLDYEALVAKYGSILIRPIGSFMTFLKTTTITEECFATDFPIEEFADIVICENDEQAEYKWVEYLKKRFPQQKIITINYFDLRSESDVQKYFEQAKIVTFSTTFSKYDWYEKLSKFVTAKHKVIGYCHSAENWKQALEINSNVEIVEKMLISAGK